MFNLLNCDANGDDDDEFICFALVKVNNAGIGSTIVDDVDALKASREVSILCPEC